MLYEDDDLLAISKPVGLAVHGGADTTRTLLDLLHQAYDEPMELNLIHRLDRATSGAMFLAKSKDAAKAVSARWSEAKKTYLGVCLGVHDDPSIIDTPLTDRERGHRPAQTTLRPVAVLDRIEPVTSVVAIELDTGRMHQIRRHLASIGHPVMLDDRHGNFAANRAFKRAVREGGGNPARRGHLLHATELMVPHPVEARSVAVTAPLPEHWRGILEAAGDLQAVARALADTMPLALRVA